MNESLEIDLASGLAAFEAKHFARAMQCLSPLADAGHKDAQYRLAIMFQNGVGVVANEAVAFHWMQQAAEQDHGPAQHGLACCYLEGSGTHRDDPAAVQWLQRAVRHGLAGALVVLAQLYETGRGVPVDVEKAKALYRQAGI